MKACRRGYLVLKLQGYYLISSRVIRVQIYPKMQNVLMVGKLITINCQGIN